MAVSTAAPSLGLAVQALGSIYGLGLAAAPAAASGQRPWPVTLGGVTVTIDGRAVPLLYVSPVQINFEIPAGTTAGDVPLTMQTGLGDTLHFMGKVLATASGLVSSACCATANTRGTASSTV
jgi:uncharacterized protein (TIGR03437 family)